jgi:hypothetical protein
MARLAALAAALLLVALAAPAAAGGWAVTTLDAVPDRFEAGRDYDIGYTIRQHGVTPVDLASTGIRITSADSGKQLRFDGRKDGAVGHYVARVSFPAAGGWTWEALQDWFAPHQLGKVEVVLAGSTVAAEPRPAAVAARAAGAAAAPAVPVAAAATAPPATAESPTNALVIAGLILALAGTAVLVGTNVATATATSSSSARRPSSAPTSRGPAPSSSTAPGRCAPARTL